VCEGRGGEVYFKDPGSGGEVKEKEGWMRDLETGAETLKGLKREKVMDTDSKFWSRILLAFLHPLIASILFYQSHSQSLEPGR